MDKAIFIKAIQAYVKGPKKNIPNLMQYAKALRVQKTDKRFNRSVVVMADIAASVFAKP